MSAFVVNFETIDSILRAVDIDRTEKKRLEAMLFDGEPNDWPREYNLSTVSLKTFIGQELLRENELSVGHRYRDDKIESIAPMYKYKITPMLSSEISKKIFQALKSIDCLEYQSCEHDTWEQSKAYEILKRFRKQLIQSHPDYDSSSWGL